MEMISCQSSRVKAYGYDPETKNLQIDWADKKNGQPGGSGNFKNVPPEVFEAMQKAESVGRFINLAIKGQFDYEKLS